MSWRVADSLLTLKEQINKKYPGRRTDSDGGIGNAEHASRDSDHNPWILDGKQGVVSAFDFTNDPAHGLDSEAMAQALVDSRDPRIKYIISNRKIAAGTKGPKPWVWRKYSGANAHDHHFHISVKDDKADYDSTKPWDLSGAPTAKDVKNSPVAAAYVPPPPLLKPGVKNKEQVKRMQILLNAKGAGIKVDGIFKPGGETEAALRDFQVKNKLGNDAKCGPATWAVLMKL